MNKFINKNLIVQIFKFSIVGIIATLIDFACLYILKEVFCVNIILSNTISFIISVIYNYIASVLWVFDVNKNKYKKKRFIIFIAFSMIGLIINDIIMHSCIQNLDMHYMFAKVIATVIVMFFNFVTRKKFLE